MTVGCPQAATSGAVPWLESLTAASSSVRWHQNNPAQGGARVLRGCAGLRFLAHALFYKFTTLQEVHGRELSSGLRFARTLMLNDRLLLGFRRGDGTGSGRNGERSRCKADHKEFHGILH